MRPSNSSDLTDSASSADVRVLASSRGRLRVHVPGWSDGPALVEPLRLLAGVHRVEANPLTGNILFLFDPEATTAATLVDAVRALVPPPPPPPPRPQIEVITIGPGRLRVHLVWWSGRYRTRLEEDLCLLPGVVHARASRFTCNVLLLFDPALTTTAELLDRLHSYRRDPTPAATPSRLRRTNERTARISVRGLDRRPRLARQLIQHLHSKHGVRARLKAATGHLLVDYDHHRVLLEEVLAEITHLELPELIGEDRPQHPLDPEPLAEALTRAIGTLLGILAMTIRRLAVGNTVAAGFGFADHVAGLFNLLQGFPFIRDALRRLLGHHTAGVVSTIGSVLALTFADAPMGLIVTGAEALLLLSEITSRRSAWRRYEDRLDGAASAEPGAMLRLEAGMRVPHVARVVEGMGSAVGHSGLPVMLSPGSLAPAGAILSGGPFVLDLQAGEGFDVEPRPAPPRLSLFDRYLRYIGPVSLSYAVFTVLRTGSLLRGFESLLLLNPRTAVIAKEAANLGAAGRVLRGGLTVVGSRTDRVVHLPDVLLLDGARLLTDGLEIAGVHAFGQPALPEDLLELAALIDAAAGSPWGKLFPPAHGHVTDGAFNGLWATARVDGVEYMLGPPENEIPDDFAEEHEGGYLLEVCALEEGQPLGFVALRPRLAAGAAELVAACRQIGVRVELVPAGAPLTAAAVAHRIHLPLAEDIKLCQLIRERQRSGARVALVADHAGAAEAFACCDMAVALASGRGDFPARADVLAPDLRGVADLLEAARRREAVVKDGLGLSLLANAIGIVVGFPGHLGVETASLTVYLGALAAMGAGWLRLRGGARAGSSLAHLSDPRPERWGRRGVEEVLQAFNTTSTGLTSADATSRRVAPPAPTNSDQLLGALRNQMRAPITALLAGGGCLTLALGQPLNTAILGTTISLNLAAGVWQERQVDQASEALQRLGAAHAQVLRDGAVVTVAAGDVVPGDVLILSPGDRVSADARLIESLGLEVDEASLTGESLPVAKGPDEESEGGRIVLEGSDVVVGTGRAIVVAVGRQTRIGATAAALNVERDEDSPLGARLGRILKIALPVALGGGVVAGLAGLVYGGAPLAMLTLSVTTALSAIPEGLPLLAGVGQAGVARRLAGHKALVRRIGAVEALGRVDVACTDKTGTLTEGKLALRLVANVDQQVIVPAPLSPELLRVLLTAALASPHPDAANAFTQPTDVAVLRGVHAAGLVDELRAPRLAEVPFDSARGFYASLFADRLCVKGAPERLLPRCTFLRDIDGSWPLDAAARTALLNRVTRLAEGGLRILMAAEGPPNADPRDPAGLTVLGFVGISDPLRPTVPGAVRRCLGAGIRVIMLTGDHPATARAIATEAGLLIPGHDGVMRAAELAELDVEALGQRLEGVAVIARATPLDKLRIIESLRLRGHTVAMTGDGVNDAPSLRLADVGVAMGRTGTEVARQASDVVLVDDDFATLVEALVEGRGFWRNMRAGLGLLLGGNVGELGVIVGGNLLGYGSPISPAQILIVNLITDALPVLAVLLQRPEHRNLAGLAREGLSALDHGLRRDVLRRGLATALPTLASYLFMHATAGPAAASAVAFTGVVATQLAQTLDAGRVEGTISRPVMFAVGGSLALLGSSVTIPPLRNFLGLLTPTPLGWGLIGGSAAAAVAISRAISLVEGRPPSLYALPEPTQ